MSIDVAPLIQVLVALALAVVSAGTPYFATLLARYLRIRLTATQAAVVQTAADAGAQAAYGYIASKAASYRDVTVRNAAIARGVQHVVNSVPEAMTALGLTPGHVQAMVEARFGGLLASDPAVSIGKAPTA